MEWESFFLIARIKQVGDRILDRIILKKNIETFNSAQGRILYVLWKRDGIPMKELSKQTGLAMSSLTTMLNRMEAAKLIHRQHGDKDRREVLIFLTETSRALELDYKCMMKEINSIYYKDFDMWDIINKYTKVENICRIFIYKTLRTTMIPSSSKSFLGS